MEEKKPLVFLASPSYGSIEPELTAAVLQAGKGHDCLFSARKASLLAMNFNTLWCQALNNRHLNISHFAMIHTDIFPLEQGWLDHMLAEMDAVGADLLSVIVPLKDDRGLTSCGWLDREGHITRLTMKQVYELPPTFTAESLGVTDKSVVINTGLWVCRFDQPWIEQVYFTIRDGISKNDQGQFVAQVLSEDWHFSTMCANLGVKMALSRAIPLKHIGRGEYFNTSAWGTEIEDRGDPAS